MRLNPALAPKKKQLCKSLPCITTLIKQDINLFWIMLYITKRQYHAYSYARYIPKIFCNKGWLLILSDSVLSAHIYYQSPTLECLVPLSHISSNLPQKVFLRKGKIIFSPSGNPHFCHKLAAATHRESCTYTCSKNSYKSNVGDIIANSLWQGCNSMQGQNKKSYVCVTSRQSISIASIQSIMRRQ